MIFLNKKKQQGATLLIGMIMMVVLTLLVIFSLRSGNTNLRIAGNMQSQSEAAAATQQVIEQVIEQVKVVPDMSAIAAQTLTVAVGNANYSVDVLALTACEMEIPVLTDQLDTSKANDVPCFEGVDPDPIFDSSGKPIPKPTACKTQQWQIEAGVTDSVSGTKVTHVQGISVRVPAVVNCS